MHLRNGPHGYGVVTRSLHWLTVAAISGQFAVGYLMDPDGGFREAECDPPGEDRSGGDISDALDDRQDRLEDACEAEQDRLEAQSEDGVGTAFDDLLDGSILDGGLALPEVHVVLGLTILALGVARVAWRATTPLPPWAEALTQVERALESRLEKVLLVLLFVVPGTGLLLVVGEGDWLPLHIGVHLLFFATVALHVGLVLKRTVWHRDRLLQRML